jgi:hypothetical protein
MTRHQLSAWVFGFDVPNHATGGEDRVFLDGATALELHELAERAGAEQAYQLFRFAATVAVRPWTDQHEQELRQVFDTILADIEHRIRNLPDPEEQALWFSYELLRQQKTTRPRAARLASTILGRPITPEAWRKAVNKWAHENGMPKLDLPHGRPSKKNRNNS